MVEELCAAEDKHWWYAGLQDLITRVLNMPECKIVSRPAVLDVGCGTGANLRLVTEQLSPCYVGGFDNEHECLVRATRKCPSAEVYASDLRAPELRRTTYDLVLCCDVLSSIGLEACRTGLRMIAGRLAPGGLLLLHVPACPWLLGPHDAAVGTIERYRPSQIDRLIGELELEPVIFGYRMALLFPIVAGVRLARRWLTPNRDAFLRSDLHPAAQIGSRLWRGAIKCENMATCSGIRWPIGSSLVAVARKPEA